MRRAIGAWTELREAEPENRPRFDATATAYGLRIEDTRSCTIKGSHDLSPLEADVYLFCDKGQSLDAVVREFGESPHTIGAILDGFGADRLMLASESKYLSLAIIRERALFRRLGSSVRLLSTQRP